MLTKIQPGTMAALMFPGKKYFTVEFAGVETCLAVCASGNCPIEDEDGGYGHLHVCSRDVEHGDAHRCACNKEWVDVCT